MKENQTSIYYVTGEGRKNAQMAPAMETMTAKGYEVIYLTDPLDEMTVQSTHFQFSKKRFCGVTHFQFSSFPSQLISNSAG